MAHMIPPTPKEYDAKSEEGIVFNALRKLSDDYYVFHSYSPTTVSNGTLFEREIDFVVAHKEYGVLCIEAKNGDNIHFYDRYWRYSSGQPMDHGGPYKQISSAKRSLMDKVSYHKNPDVRALSNKCRFIHAVFFFRMIREDFDKIARAGLAEDADPNITLLADDLIDPEKKIKEIFCLKLPKEKYDEYSMNEKEFKLLLTSVLCPEFNIVPSPMAVNAARIEYMNQLLYEQYNLLKYLEYQPSAVINGAAGTGKTMLAVRKAQLHSENGEKVLFLCYNRLLCDKLNETHKKCKDLDYRAKFSNVDFMTISQLVKEKTGNFRDLDRFVDWLFECMEKPDLFEYKHVIIDEGQDFGLVDASIDKSTAEKNCSIIDCIQEIVLSSGGTFYLFYDKYQMIQGGAGSQYCLPECISNSDCKLTLYQNCRNTKEIAKTSVTPIKDKRNKPINVATACSWYEPIRPKMHLIQEESLAIDALNGILSSYKAEGIDDVVILTEGTIEHSLLAEYLTTDTQDPTRIRYYYKFGTRKYPISTCIMFKGLEADAIILLDLNKYSFLDKKGLEFYVGASRAKLRLDMICNINEDEYYEVVHSIDPNAPYKKNPINMRKILGNAFSADVSLIGI